MFCKFFLSAIFILITLSLESCGPVALPPVKSYAIGNGRPPSNINIDHRISLLVPTPTASPGFEGTAMRYMLIPYQLEAFSRNRWIGPPAEMLQPIIIQALQTAGFNAVNISPGVTDLRLDMKLLILQQELMLPVSQIRLKVSVALFSNAENRIIGTHIFQVIVPAPENNPYSGVLATNNAATILSNQIARFCAHSAGFVSGRGKKAI